MTSSLKHWLQRSQKWHIEYDGFFSNHLSHNLVVMSLAGVPEKYLERWYNDYTNKHNLKPKLEPDSSLDLRPQNWMTHIQKSRVLFPELNSYFTKQIAEHGPQHVLSTHLPHLLPGLAGGLLHPLIHTGLAIEADDDGMLAEGLAYMATAFQPLGTKNKPVWSSKSKQSIIELSLQFLQLAEKKDFPSVAISASQSDKYMARDIGNTQRSLITFDDDDLELGEALNSMGPLGLPKEDDLLSPAIIDATTFATCAYLGSDCEFVVVHSVTSLFAVLKMLPSLDAESQRNAIAYWWRATMAAMNAQRLPGLNKTALLIKEWMESDKCKTVKVPSEDEWSKVLEASWESDDEHVQKGVFCMWRWSRIPEMPESSQVLMYRAAVNQVRPHPSGNLSNHLWFGNGFKRIR